MPQDDANKTSAAESGISSGFGCWLAVVGSLIMSVLALWNTPLPNRAGAIYGAATEIARHGDWFAPRLHGEIPLETAALWSWPQALFMLVFGVGEPARIAFNLCIGLLLTTGAYLWLIHRKRTVPRALGSGMALGALSVLMQGVFSWWFVALFAILIYWNPPAPHISKRLARHLAILATFVTGVIFLLYAVCHRLTFATEPAICLTSAALMGIALFGALANRKGQTMRVALYLFFAAAIAGGGVLNLSMRHNLDGRNFASAARPYLNEPDIQIFALSLQQAGMLEYLTGRRVPVLHSWATATPGALVFSAQLPDPADAAQWQCLWQTPDLNILKRKN